MNRLTPVQREELLEILWEKSMVGVAILTKDGTFEYANAAFCKLVEYSEPELQRKRFHDITVPEDLAADQTLAADVADGRRDDYLMKKRYITKTGRVIWVVLSVQPMRIHGEFHYFVSQVSEVFPIMGVPVLAATLPKKSPWAWIKENWPVLSLMMGGAAYFLGETAKHFIN